MNQKNRWTTIALVVSVLFGASIALMAVLDYPSIGTFAGVGGILVGLMWVLILFVSPRSGSRAPD